MTKLVYIHMAELCPHYEIEVESERIRAQEGEAHTQTHIASEFAGQTINALS